MELSALHSIVEKLDKKVDNEVLVLREGIADLKRGQQAPLKAAGGESVISDSRFVCFWRGAGLARPAHGAVGGSSPQA